MRDFAERLIVLDTSLHQSSKERREPSFFIGEKLRPHLAVLMSNVGASALLSRALVLSSVEIPWLRHVHVKADGSLEGLDKLDVQTDSENFRQGKVILLAQLLGLMVALIGERLTLWLVAEAWPELSPYNLAFGEVGKK
jgi:hypothetical protein